MVLALHSLIYLMMRPFHILSIFLFCGLVQTALPKVVWGQTPPAAAAAQDDDAALQPVEPDFTLVNLPTTLRLPLHKSNFHLTHRFQGRDYRLTDVAGNVIPALIA